MAGLLDYTSSVAGEVKKNVQGLLADPRQALKDVLNNLTSKAAASQAKTKAAWATRDPKVMAQNALDSSQTALGFAPLGILNVNGMPNRGRDFIQKSADDLAEVLNKKGFKATVQHSGSAGGPSSYVSIFDPQTGRFINDPVRFSGHTKGVFNSQSIHDISGPEDVQKIIDLAQSMREAGPTAMWMNQLKGK
jgi:hypothetical protein